MTDYTRFKYSGSTPGADSSDYVLFSTVTAFGGKCAHQMAGLHKLVLNLFHTQAGTLKLYRSGDRGTTWTQVASESVSAPSAGESSQYEALVECFEDFKLVWTNGGSAQTTWVVDMALTDERFLAVGGSTIDGVPWIGDTGTVSASGSAYQWYRDGVEIGGATSQNYVYTSDDIGPEITCAVDGRVSAAVQTYFDDVAERTGVTADLAACWDCRDLTAGAVTTFTDRVAGYVLSGTGTCDTSINSKKTLVLSGAGTGFLTTANVSNLNGAQALTNLTVLKTNAIGVWWQYSPDAFSNTGGAIVAGGSFSYELYIKGATGINGYGHAEASMNVAKVRSCIGDFLLTTKETSQQWVNGTLATPVATGYETNNTPAATFGDYKLSLGMTEAGGSRMAGSFCGAVVFYRRALTWDERQHAELILGYLSGVTVSVVAQTVAGIAFAMAGQSNSLGLDTDLSSLPGTWPPADTAAQLKRRQGTAGATTYAALAEPVNGVGGTHAVSFADAIIRDAGYSGFTEVCINPAPPVSGSAIAQWAQGTTNYNNLLAQMYTMRTLHGYALGGLLWSQGENDTITTTDRDAYLAATQAVFAALRSDLSEPDLRIVFFQIHDTWPNAGWPYWEAIQAHQATIAAADSNMVLIPTSGARMGDNLHLLTATQKTHGEAAAVAYLAEWPSPP